MGSDDWGNLQLQSWGHTGTNHTSNFESGKDYIGTPMCVCICSQNIQVLISCTVQTAGQVLTKWTMLFSRSFGFYKITKIFIRVWFSAFDNEVLWSSTLLMFWFKQVFSQTLDYYLFLRPPYIVWRPSVITASVYLCISGFWRLRNWDLNLILCDSNENYTNPTCQLALLAMGVITALHRKFGKACSV